MVRIISRHVPLSYFKYLNKTGSMPSFLESYITEISAFTETILCVQKLVPNDVWISIQIGQIRLGLNTSKVKDWDGYDGPFAFRQWKRAANINWDGQVTKFTDSTNFSHVNIYGGLILCHKLLSNYCPHEITCILSPSDSHMADCE